MNMPHLRYVAFSYAATLTLRDNRRFLSLLQSESYQELWGDRFGLLKVGEELVSNDKTGWKLASSVGGVGTGERGNRVLVDDPHNVKEQESDLIRASTVRWFQESIQSRLNDLRTDAIVVIMQRVHEADVSGAILEGMPEYTHLCIPMEFDRSRYCETQIGWSDPREQDGELAWPERFGANELRVFKRIPYLWSGQYQQSPAPRGGGIIKREWWQLWNDDLGRLNGVGPGKFPPFNYIIASIDTAYTQKQENDPSACTVWGVWQDHNGVRRFMLVSAWSERLELHDLVERVAQTCREFRVSRILIEARASGHSVAQELRRRYLTVRDQLGTAAKTSGHADFSVQLIDPKNQDKVARVHAVVPIFAAGLVYAPDKTWAEAVIGQCESFPKAKHDDLVDSMSQALAHFRAINLAEFPDERDAFEAENKMHHGPMNGFAAGFWNSIAG